MNFLKKKVIIKINLYSYHKKYLNIFIKNLNFFIKDNIKIINLPLKKTKYTVIRSPHIYKKSREQFERSTHKKVIYITFLNKSSKNIKELISFINENSIGLQSKIKKLNGKI